jgi:phage tail sheath protein FI
MSNYYTPGVYVEEISTLPPSVVEGSTAIPAFLGYTQKTEYGGIERKLVPTRISTMLEFIQYFGYPPTTVVTATTKKADDTTTTIVDTITITKSLYTLYYSLDLFFKNGGSYCYIVSIGKYKTDGTLDKDEFGEGLKALAKEDEPTLIVLSEACGLTGASDYYTLCQDALEQCAKLKNRFCILDVQQTATGDAIEKFRTGVGLKNLQYGAVYYPYLKTSIGPAIDDANVTVKGITVSTSSATANDAAAAAGTGAAAAAGTGTAASAAAGTSADANKTKRATAGEASLKEIKTTYTGLYSAIKNELNGAQYKVVLPASAAIAGVYASVDRDRGVWKAPANVSLNSVIEPVTKITAAEQEKLNVHADGGKSVNAIRSFTGKGILVWGARTLAGNDNEWRYVPVRRLFNLIEDSASKATSFAVFEPNDATTWLKVQSMIDSYLYGLWQQGALAGSTAKAAYFVKVGLGSTMTTQDILEGRMIVEIGVAAVRPAEFIVLRFSHKLQEA